MPREAQAVKAWEEQTVSTQAPAREERQTPMHSESTREAVTGAGRRAPFARDRARADRHLRPRVALAVMGATTFLGLGALLGARFIGRRIERRGATRITGGSPSIVVMFPFTALNFYGRTPRRLTLPRLPDRIRRFRRATAAR